MSQRRAMILSALLSGLVATSCATTGGTPSAAANSGLEEGASPTTSAASAPTRPPEPLDRRDVAYASASPRQRLDLYVPSSGAAPYPLVVWIHGGGWERGDQTLAPDAPVRTLLTDGFAVASVDYRLSQDAPFPAQIDDVKAAVRFLRANAVTWSLDPKRFGAWGDSAGGHLAALLGTTGGVATFDAAALGNVDESSRVQAVVDWYGPSSFSTMDAQFAEDGCAKRADPAWSVESKLIGAAIPSEPALAAAASPITYVTPDDPPMLIEHGTSDCMVPWQQSALLAGALTKAIGAANVTEVLLPLAGHGGEAFTGPANLARVVSFFTSHLR